MEDNYLDLNRASWNERTQVHFESSFYDNESFIKGRNSLNSIELEFLGDVKDKTILHLQCHFGQDTISLSRMGAKCTGVDLSDAAVEKAQELALLCGENVSFIRSDVYELPKVLNEKFDIVFTSYGTIGWLPDLNKWAEVLTHFTKPGGRFVFAEFHPVVWMMDDNFEKIDYSYFNREAIIEEKDSTYSDGKLDKTIRDISWNHDLSEVLTAILNRGFNLEEFKEYDYSPYPCFNRLIEKEKGKFQIEGLEGKLPMVYALSAFIQDC